MPNFSTLQLSSAVPEGSYSLAIANIGGEWLNAPLLGTVIPSRCTAVADFIRFTERYTIIAGTETKQLGCQVGLWSRGWAATANYSWFLAAQNTTVASFGTVEATVWRPTNAEE